MSINPFDDDNGGFLVLIADEGHHTPRLAITPGPPGRRVVYGEAERAVCPDYIEQNWTDIRPKNLSQKLAAGRGVDT